jgi:hypothetical protein
MLCTAEHDEARKPDEFRVILNKPLTSLATRMYRKINDRHNHADASIMTGQRNGSD